MKLLDYKDCLVSFVILIFGALLCVRSTEFLKPSFEITVHLMLKIRIRFWGEMSKYNEPEVHVNINASNEEKESIILHSLVKINKAVLHGFLIQLMQQFAI